MCYIITIQIWIQWYAFLKMIMCENVLSYSNPIYNILIIYFILEIYLWNRKISYILCIIKYLTKFVKIIVSNNFSVSQPFFCSLS